MEHFAHFDSSFNLNKTSTYHLNLIFSDNYYAYCLKDTIRKQYVAIKKSEYPESKRTLFSDKIKDAIKNDVYLNKSYKSVDLIFKSNKFTLVPNEIFDKSNLKSFFKFNNDLKSDEEIHFNKLKLAEAVNLFIIPSSVTTFLVNKFPEVKFYQQASSIIEFLINETKESKSDLPTVFVNFSNDYFDVISVNKGKLLFYNCFNYRTSEDYIYYFLNVLKNLDYQPNKVEILLAGDIDQKSDLYLKSYKYFNNYKFAKVTNNFNYGFEVPEHTIANILI